jgi:tetratricopeptide (TPR) repeat protein
VSVAPARHWALKAGAIALATFLAGCSLLPQSRGATIAVILAAAVLVALSPLRWRAAARLAVVGGVLAVFSGPIFGLYDVASEGVGVGAAVDDAARAVLLATLVAGLLGAALALGEARVRVPQRTARTSGIVALAVLALAGIGAAAVNADRIDRLIDRQREAWNHPGNRFEEAAARHGSTRLLSSDPLQRYQYWHVALDGFADHPLVGLGAGGFERAYTERRTEAKYSSFPHSLFMRVLAEGGIVGVLLMLAFLAAVLAGTLRGLRAAGAEDRLVTAGALAAGVCFLVHAQLDWLEEFPSLAGPAVGFLVIALSVRRGEPAGMPPLPYPDMAAAGVLAVAALMVLVPPYAGLRYKERATAIWRTDPAKAYRDLDRASGLDPLSDQARLTEGTIALQRRELERARRAFEAALEREDGWLAHFELALILAAQGDRGAATRQLDAAEAVNPQEPAIPAARQEIESGKVVDPVRLNKRLFESPLFNARRLT